MKHKSLNEFEHSYLLVGRYMWEWAIMEGHIHEAIAEGLELTPLPEAIVCANLNFYSKCHVLKTLVYTQFAEDDQKPYNDLIERIKGRTTDRNMVAHHAFFPNEKKTGVKFYMARAKGKFAVPNIVWTPKEFQTKFDELDEFAKGLKKLAAALRGQARLFREKGIRRRIDTMKAQRDSNLLSLLYHPPEADDTSDTSPSTHQKGEQTPSSSET